MGVGQLVEKFGRLVQHILDGLEYGRVGPRAVHRRSYAATNQKSLIAQLC